MSPASRRAPAPKSSPTRLKPAAADAPVVRRLRAGGAVIVAKTNMTEFALGAIGANPHFGTPANPRDRARVPGGSSSGAAVTVGDRMAEIAIGSDTGGSVRIPAALCGIVGFKPSRQRVPTAGAFPLSTTLDSIGPLANSVADCAKAFVVMADAVMADAVMAARISRRSSLCRSQGFASASRKAFRWRIWKRRSRPRSMRPPSDWRKPACGSPASRCRCSTKCGR